MAIRHTTVASDPQDPLLGADDWNADHTAPDIADVTGLQSALDAKAPLASPEFTGTVEFTTQQAASSAGTTFKTNSGSDWLHGANGGSPNATAYGGWNFDAATANTLASFGASKTLTSLDTATYPSLTEISYVKGVTSAVQTQLGAKANRTAGELLNPTLLDTSAPNKGWNFDFSGSFANAIGTHVSWLTDDRTWTWPDKNGTVAFLDDIPNITVSTTAPSSPSVGDLWVDTN